MFSNKENINILTSLLIGHGIRKAVVCPGSRNAAIIHNLYSSASIDCYSVTDERSAGFYALGMSLADNEPVAVCVTSGSALLNLAPAVAEATYRHHGLIVISADRPQSVIGQLEGQTLVQPGSYNDLISKSVTLPEPVNDEERWYCNRLVNEALMAVRCHGRKSVHINLPISEPMFVFDKENLPDERIIRMETPCRVTVNVYKNLIERLLSAERPMIAIGQINGPDESTERAIKAISERFVTVCEPLSTRYYTPFDLALGQMEDDDSYLPTFVLYLGGTFVSKRIKSFLRKASACECWNVSEDGEVHDTFRNLSCVIEAVPNDVLVSVASHIKEHNADDTDCQKEYFRKWQCAFDDAVGQIQGFCPEFSQPLAIKEFETSLEDMDYEFHVHYANSTSVRLGNLYAGHYVWCNRGVNGIEGSLSVAAGFSLSTDDMVFCVIGDLSFFYDQNALWNGRLKGNFRVLLLNNGGGGIFRNLPGLTQSNAYDEFISARHHAGAKGVCSQNDIGYISARTWEEMQLGLVTLLTEQTKRPMVLEVFTDMETDGKVMKELMKIGRIK